MSCGDKCTLTASHSAADVVRHFYHLMLSPEMVASSSFCKDTIKTAKTYRNTSPGGVGDDAKRCGQQVKLQELV